MKKEDEVPPLESGEGEQENPLTPKPEPQLDLSDTDAKSDEPDSEGETGPAEEEPFVESEPLVEPEPTTSSPQKKKPSGKVFLVLFLGFLLTGLSAAVYFLVEERSKTFLEIQEKLALLDSKLGAIQTSTKDSGQTARDFATLRQEFQTFREQVAESLASRQTPVTEPPTPTEEPDEVEEHETATHSDEVASQMGQAPTEPPPDLESSDDSETSPDQEYVSLAEDTGSHEPPLPSHGEIALEHPQAVQSPPPHKPTHEPEELPGEQVERSKEVQQYINFVESTAAKLFELVKKGSNTAWDYLVDLLG